jgi:UDP-N-acetylmuramoyl-L-alanyl-D-glutamate--2,6-diaminopimelate ligase
MELSELIRDIHYTLVAGETDLEVTGIVFDSRQVSAGSVFVAVRGTGTDGHAFIGQAIRAGAVVIVAEKDPEEDPADLCWLRVSNSRSALARMASAWYDHPSRELHLVGVTGTNGKTTVATLLHRIYTNLGYSAGLISTIQVLIGEEARPATHTTPDPLQINGVLRDMVESGCGFCFMEVSSHAIDQDRIGGLEFKGGIFTNLTRDHLDYHRDFREYLEVKKRFFDQLPAEAFALVNLDDKNGQVMLQNCEAETYTYSLRSSSDFRARILEMHMEGTSIEIDGSEVWVKLPGRFNASNLLCIYAAGVLSGQDPEDMLRALSEVGPVKGRFETYRSEKGITGVVDYAHTPDALQNVLETLVEVNSGGGRILTVVGAGGDRDRGKRPMMARIAAGMSNRTILTSDNPRNEDPEAILDDMMKGIPEEAASGVVRITSREEAIRTACLMAHPGDIILVAGKGHENYQVIGEKRYPFNDMMILQKNLN